MALQTEFEFTLPRGYLDSAGQLHLYGRMRLAFALDEIEAANDPRVQANPAFLPALLLSRVITQLGNLPAITPQVITGLFAADLVFLEDLYQRINAFDQTLVQAVCPYCSQQFPLQVAPLASLQLTA